VAGATVIFVLDWWEWPVLDSIVLAGGSGTRLWPLSRAGHPKFLHPLTGTDRTLLQATVDRLDGVSAPGQVYVVTGTAHAAAVSRQLPDVPDDNILVEPSPRDSCAAIALAVAVIARRDPEAAVGVFASDHLIADQNRFTEIIQTAESVARQGYLVTVGIQPTRAEVGYGYLRTGESLADGGRLVREFKEKPAHEVALAYVESGEYLWNAGMFVFTARTFLAELAERKPEMHATVLEIAAAWDRPDRETVLAELWPGLEKISVDYAVMEGAAAGGRVATVPADFPWSDVGDFNSLGEALPCDRTGNVVLGRPDTTLVREAKSCVVVSASERLVAAVGVDDLVVVETADAVLVLPRSRAAEVKHIVDELRGLGLQAFV
jgi:mannose-1-phosphate guanylyltransferase